MSELVEHFLLQDAGTVPNNPRLPLVIYRQAIEKSGDMASRIEEVFSGNDWEPAWRYTIYDYTHYHSTAHEVIGIYRGWASVQFGDTAGITARVRAGDVVVIPAGVSHRRIESSPDFHGVGAYPAGQEPDMRKAQGSERPDADRRIQNVPLPETDPVFGRNGPLMDLWDRTR